MSSISTAEFVMNTNNCNEGPDDAACWARIERDTRKIEKREKVGPNAHPYCNKIGSSDTVANPTKKHFYNAKSDTSKGFQLAGKIFGRLCSKSQSTYKGAALEFETSHTCTENSGLISDIDSGTKSRIDRGKYPIAAKLDLHGLNTDIAFDMLVDFIINSFEARYKCVLVITGWGSKSNGTSIIRQNLHRWLQSKNLAGMVLYYTQAQPAHGGKGAFYVLLRTKRKVCN